MTAIVMTGASGLLGMHLLPLLGGCEIHAIGRSPIAGAPANVRHVEADLARPLDRSRLPQRINAVVHLAQSSRFREFPEGAQDVFAVNVERVMDLLDYARQAGAGAFVHASTGGVYRPGQEPLRESDALPAHEALGFYPASKLAAEMLARSFAGTMRVGALRYFFIYGRGQQRHMLVPRLVDSVRKGQPVRLQGRDGLRLNPVHAGDAAAATAAALELSDSATVNVAGPETLSIRAMAETIGEQLGIEPLFEQAGEAAGDLVADITLMRRLLAEPTRRFRDCVGELLR